MEIDSTEKVVEIIGGTAEARNRKIGMLKKAITEGTYEIRAGDVAWGMMKELLVERALILNKRLYWRSAGSKLLN